MYTPSDRQIIYRQYLQSPVWKAKRLEALAHYGTVCSRCAKYGDDVHHKTYARVGGEEMMSDLEVLCRDCHEVHHVIERVIRSRRRKERRQSRPQSKRIHERALRGYLTFAQKQLIIDKFHISCEADLMLKIMHLDKEVCRFAARLVGCDQVYRTTGQTFNAFMVKQRKKNKKFKMKPGSYDGTTTESY